jgi:hypothetical protein
VNNRLSIYLAPICEFLLFFSLTALLLAGVDFMYFLVSHRKPAASENFWCLSAFSVIWIIGGLWCHFGSNLENLPKPSFKQEESTTHESA